MKTALIILILNFSSMIIYGQENNIKKDDSNNITQNIKEKKLVINEKLIKAFNDYDFDEKQVKLYNIYEGLCHLEKIEFL